MNEFIDWCKEQGFEVRPLNDGSGKGHIVDVKMCSQFKMHLSNGGLTVLKDKVVEWQSVLYRERKKP